jgi:hypothetical protein
MHLPITQMFTAMASILLLVTLSGCSTTQPRIRQVEELRYGDEESSIVDSIGEGLETLFFKIGDTHYGYRFYEFPAARSSYSFLFRNQQLVYVEDERLPFHQCILQAYWNDCFTGVVSKLRTHDASKQVGFSEAISQEKRTETIAITGIAIVVPASIVIWPITLGWSGAAAATDAWNPADDWKMRKSDEACRDTLHEFENQVRPLFPDATVGEIEDLLAGLRLDVGRKAYRTAEENIENTIF